MSVTVFNNAQFGTSNLNFKISQLDPSISNVDVEVPFGIIERGSTSLVQCFASVPERRNNPTTMVEYMNEVGLERLNFASYVDQTSSFTMIRGNVPVYGSEETEVICAFQSSNNMFAAQTEEDAMDAIKISHNGTAITNVDKVWIYDYQKEKPILNVSGPYDISLHKISPGTTLTSIALDLLVSTTQAGQALLWEQEDVNCTAITRRTEGPAEVSMPMTATFTIKPLEGSTVTFDPIVFDQSVFHWRMVCPDITLQSHHPGYQFIEAYSQYLRSDHICYGLIESSSSATFMSATLVLMGVLVSLMVSMM